MTISAYAAPTVKLQFTDNAGAFLNGGLLFVYAAGTTTKINTYADAQLVTPNTNPIVLDSEGRCTCFITPGQAVKFVLSPSTDTDPPTNAIWTVDNVEIVADGIPFALDTGTANALVGTVVGLPTTLRQGNSCIVYTANACTGATTANINGAGAIAVKDQNGSALGNGAFAANQPLLLTYDGTFWRTVVIYPWPQYAVDSGTNNAMVATVAGLPSVRTTGVSFYLKTATSCTASATLNLNGIGAVTLKDKNGANLTSGAYAAAQVFPVIDDGTNWRTLF